jgi:dUTP pyrophosphatase
MTIEQIYFAQLRKDAIIPSRRDEDGCYDVYACFDEEEMIIQSGEVRKIPTGLISAFPSNRRIGGRERGSNTLSGLVLMAGQIDSGYRGEWFIPLLNPQPFPVVISKNVTEYFMITEPRWKFEYRLVPYKKAICQFAIEEVPQDEIVKTSVENILAMKSLRGTGALGSSGK